MAPTQISGWDPVLLISQVFALLIMSFKCTYGVPDRLSADATLSYAVFRCPTTSVVICGTRPIGV